MIIVLTKMLQLVKHILKKLIHYTITTALFLYLDVLVNRKKIIVLMYHGVTDRHIPQGSVENYDGKHVFVQTFEKQLQLFIERYTFISLEQLMDYFTKKKALPKNPVLITFDDGYKNNYHIAVPILRKFNIPAAIFICPGLVGKKAPNWPDLIEYAVVSHPLPRMEFIDQGNKYVFDTSTPEKKISSITALKNTLFRLSAASRTKIIKQIFENYKIKKEYGGNYTLMNWNEIKELNRQNISVGSHTINHPILTSETPLQALWQLAESKKMIEVNIGKNVLSFAYPNGVFNENVQKLVKKAGYLCAFTTQWGKNTHNTNPHLLKRIPITNNNSLDIFALNLICNFSHVLFLLRNFLR